MKQTETLGLPNRDSKKKKNRDISSSEELDEGKSEDEDEELDDELEVEELEDVELEEELEDKKSDVIFFFLGRSFCFFVFFSYASENNQVRYGIIN